MNQNLIKKAATTLFIVFFSVISCGQTNNDKALLDKAKTLFKSEKNLNQEELDKFDYSQIVSLLEKAIKLNPENSEARYFLGYAYSRINSRDGRGMMDMNLNLLYKTSEQFQEVIKLTPKYTGEIITLDPYSKLTAEWGSMAMSYWYKNKGDSAAWAFREGKKRGGFSDFILGLSRMTLDACSKNAILISSGDNASIPLWYLQIYEKHRTDVAVVDISLLNSTWYPGFLSKTKSVSFDLPNGVLDTLEYTTWKDTTITISNFSWTVKPTYYDQYLLRGDQIFLSLLKENKFQRDIYFTIGFIEENYLNLTDYLTSLVLIDKLSVFDKSNITYENYKETISKVLMLSKGLNMNSQDEIKLFNYFRYDILIKINKYLINGDKRKAEELMNLLDTFAGKEKVPYQDENLEKQINHLRMRI